MAEEAGPSVGIDPALMGKMNAELDRVRQLVEQHVFGLQKSFIRASVDLTPIKQLGQIHWWIGDKLPMLKRRQSMAEQLARLETGMSAPSTVRVASEWPGNFASPEAARQRAGELADRYVPKDTADVWSEWKEVFPPEVWEEIRANRDDPDFAEAFLRRLGPEKTASLCAHLRLWGDAEARGLSGSFARMMATASHRDIFNEEWIHRFSAPPDVHGRYNLRNSFDLFNQLIKEDPGPWATNSLVVLGKALPPAAVAVEWPNISEIFMRITKDPEALQRLLADEQSAKKILSWDYMSNPEIRKHFTEGVKKALDQQTTEPAQLAHAWQNVVKFGASEEFQSLLAEDHELASVLADNFMPYLGSASYLQSLQFAQDTDRVGALDAIPSPPLGSPTLWVPDDLKGEDLSNFLDPNFRTDLPDPYPAPKLIQDFLGGTLRHHDVREKFGQEFVRLQGNTAVLPYLKENEFDNSQIFVDGSPFKQLLARDFGFYALISGAFASGYSDERAREEAQVDFWSSVAAGTVVGVAVPTQGISAEFAKNVVSNFLTPLAKGLANQFNTPTEDQDPDDYKNQLGQQYENALVGFIVGETGADEERVRKSEVVFWSGELFGHMVSHAEDMQD